MSNRRSFMRKMGLGLAGGLVFPYGSLGCRPVSKKIGVCLVGLGSYSTNQLAPALQLTEHCELRGIVTGSPGKIPIWQKKYGIKDKNVYSYDTMERISDNPDIDVVYIVLPTGLHAEYAIKAANTGKHVWCEKPMAKTVAECEAIMEACAKNKVKLSIGYRMQHEPNTKTVIAWAKERPYGVIQKVTAEIGFDIQNPRDSWRMKKDMGGGLLYDVGVYAINAMRYATDMEPISVTGRFENTRPEVYTEIPETTIFDLQFPEGITASGRTTAKENLNLLKVECKNGWYQLRPFQSYNGVVGETSDGRLLDTYIENQQARQMDNDALAILNDTPVMVPGENGLQDIKIVAAINRSAEMGVPVSLR